MIALKNTLSMVPAVALATGILAMTAPGMAWADNLTTLQDHATMHVTKSPTCGCCGAWVALARKEGFEVEITDTGDVTAAKLAVDLPEPLWSCHTAQIAGYVVEGHVPFEAISLLLETRPDIDGIAVPGMPAGSPGMGDDPTARFDVIAYGGAAGEGQTFYQAGQ